MGESEPAPAAPAGGAWAPPRRPGRLRIAINHARARLAGLKPPEPAPPPSVPEGWEIGPPDFVGIGVQRAGTSRWFRLISAHPDVSVAPGGDKEIHFFDRLPFMRNPPADLAAAYNRYFPRRPGTITGEWTPCYLPEFWALPRLVEVAPEARLLVALRDPVARFESAIARVARRSHESGHPLRPYHYAVAIARSLYAEQLERLFALVPRERVLVLQFERCVADPEGELRRTWEFLGLGPAPLPAGLIEERVNRAGAEPVLPEGIAADARAAVRGDLRRLRELLPELDFGLWPSAQGL